MASRGEPKVGDRAPEFTLESSTGSRISLADFRGRSEVVLFFYPKANTPFCTAEACTFRANEESFRKVGAQVIGISSASPEALARFASLRKLPFLLLSDPDGEVRRKYGVSRTFGFLPGRVTYLIDREGIIRHIYSSQFQPTRHAVEMLGVLRDLHGERSPEA